MQSKPTPRLLHRFGWLRKLPATELKVLKDRFRYGKAVFLFERLSETGDRHLLERKGDVEREMLVACPVGHDRLPRWSH